MMQGSMTRAFAFLFLSCLSSICFDVGFTSIHICATEAAFVGHDQRSLCGGRRPNAHRYLESRHSNTQSEDNFASFQTTTTAGVTRNTKSKTLPLQKKQKHPLPPTSNLVGIIFDMDGTLTKPCIDFADMRRRIYDIADADPHYAKLSPDSYHTCSVEDDESGRGCVLEIADQLSPQGQELANIVFRDIEAKALRDMEFAEGVKDICDFLDAQGIRRAVLTRNVEKSLEAMHNKLENTLGVNGGRFVPAVARDTVAPVLDCSNSDAGEEVMMETIPMKPNPDAILHICNEWNCHPMDVIMVGDSATDDVAAAYRAGCGGRVLINTGADNDSGFGGPQNDEEIKERTPHVTVTSLLGLLDLLQKE